MIDKGIFLTLELLRSTAFLSLKSANSIRVLLEFYRRRKMSKTGRKGKQVWTIVNNGEIVFTYTDAKKSLGIPQTTFSRCISELVYLGFIDISVPADGLHRVATKYAISSRWRDYGKESFQKTERKPQKPPHARKKHSYHERLPTNTNNYHERAIEQGIIDQQLP